MDLLGPVELLLLVIVDGVGHLPMAFREVHIEDGLGNATWRRDYKVEGSRHTLVHADIGEASLFAVGCG